MTNLRKTNRTPSWWGPRLKEIFAHDPNIRDDFSGVVLTMDSTEMDFSMDD